MFGFVKDSTDKGSMMQSEDKMEKIVDLYMSAEDVRDKKHKKNTENCETQSTETQTSQQTENTCISSSGSSSVHIKSASTVCLGLLCVLLLTAVIVLSVYIYTNSTNYTQETHRLTEERDALQTNITNLKEEKDNLIIQNRNLLNETEQLKLKNENARNQLNNTLQSVDGWTYYGSSFYYMSNETRIWEDSRRDCTNRRADLVIINNKEEQDFVMNITHNQEFWIGLTDIAVENNWKWVDGTNMTSRFWASSGSVKEPNGNREENCVVTHLKHHPELVGWLDVSCNNVYQWICEKSIISLTQP